MDDHNADQARPRARVPQSLPPETLGHSARPRWKLTSISVIFLKRIWSSGKCGPRICQKYASNAAQG